MYSEKLNIKSWAEEDRPREKLLSKGRSVLSDAELIAILIGSGNRNESAVELSKRILKSIDNDLNKLGKLSVKELIQFNGIGEAKAISIVAALELGRRRKNTDNQLNKNIKSSKDVFEEVIGVMSDLPHEEFWVLFLDRRNAVIKKSNVSKGGVSGTVADAKIIFKEAIQLLASAVILCHNHPSGNLKPSDADMQLTKKMKEIGNMMDVPVLDHLIVTDKSYYSFADEGLM
ncbi:MAG: DNA repair protein RadC [Flavobacteriales bacterium]|nr:DNA repair protein RadC [Flavobacteriales bacterium]MCW8914095.1 DNA repair protein RadC [Flavobacteriales bacterium]MCW8938153.1 DNA repair protein RadC [Flavobacteriales bacterium]MCW8939467.1 DNA repair protein RadC [Flavobacteriales bacterium]MCW8968228.1 DNA repair protein RadC [Flavobacteriales bacterium]